MVKERRYICEDCGYRKTSIRTPDNFKKCPYCGKNSFIVDTLNTDLLVREADASKA